MFCSECGKQVEDNAKFCGECGAVQSDVEQVVSKATVTSSAAPGSGNSNVAGYVIGAIWLVLLFSLYGKKEGSIEQPAERFEAPAEVAPAEVAPAEVVSDMDWYAPESFSFECKLDEGPSKMIESMQTIGVRYTAIEDKKIGNVVVQLTLQIPSKGVQITYYRGKDRCDAAISAKKDAEQSAAEKYK